MIGSNPENLISYKPGSSAILFRVGSSNWCNDPVMPDLVCGLYLDHMSSYEDKLRQPLHELVMNSSWDESHPGMGIRSFLHSTQDNRFDVCWRD